MNENLISKEQAEKMTAEFQELFQLAEVQLEEHKEWMRHRLREYAAGMPYAQCNAFNVIIEQVDELIIEVVRAEPNVVQLVKENDQMMEKKTLSIIYIYPDELFEFLKSDVAPADLQRSLESANVHDMEDKPSFSIQMLPKTKATKV